MHRGTLTINHVGEQETKRRRAAGVEQMSVQQLPQLRKPKKAGKAETNTFSARI